MLTLFNFRFFFISRVRYITIFHPTELLLLLLLLLLLYIF